MPDILFLTEITENHEPYVGGKASSLAWMLRQGFPVPPGFVLTTDVYQRLHRSDLDSDSRLLAELQQAYHRLAAPLVAVRSSALGEDGQEKSFAGQQETILGVRSFDELLPAITRCWNSLQSERAIVYRQQNKIPDHEARMAVVIQVQVDATVAGVLFTHDPQDPTGENLCVESSWGLGEVVVSGKVTPDRFHVEFSTGTIRQRQLGDKWCKLTPEGEIPCSSDEQQQFSLTETSIHSLHAMAVLMEEKMAQPCDIEWAFAQEKLFVLQTRPITTIMASEREKVRQAVIHELQEIARLSGGQDTFWLRYNLSETLPRPTPLTWSVYQFLLREGFIKLNQDLGGDPDPNYAWSGYDLVAGQPMANMARLPYLQFRHPPIDYPVQNFRQNPQARHEPIASLNLTREGVLRGLLRLPKTIYRVWKMNQRIARLSENFAERFLPEIAQPFAQECRHYLAQQTPHSQRSVAECLKDLDYWIKKTCVHFAAESLKPTVLAEHARQELSMMLKPTLGTKTSEWIVKLSHPEPELLSKQFDEMTLTAGVTRLTSNLMSKSDFLELFGHRGANEMELAAPRWSEVPLQLEEYQVSHRRTTPMGERESEATNEVWRELISTAKLRGPMEHRVRKAARKFACYLHLRECAKNTWLLGMMVLRTILLELDKLLQLQGEIWYLTYAELQQGFYKTNQADRAARKRRRMIEETLEVPDILFLDELNTIGCPAAPLGNAKLLQGVSLSGGVAEGRALVLTYPDQAIPEEPYILVCPSTDPGWVKYFPKAMGLVMERGGVLSHGAIVAREFALPAVAGISQATQRLTSGQFLRINGYQGTVELTTDVDVDDS